MSSSTKNSECTEKLVLAATQLFSRQGYSGTTTREIARLADVSENTLFRHFDHKEDLFWAALRSHSAWVKRCTQSLDGIALMEAPEVVLPKILELLNDTVKYKPELLRLTAVAFIELHWKADAFCQEQFAPFCATIRQYMALSVKNGRVRDCEPTIVTAALLTAVLMHPALSRLIDGENPSYSDSREAAKAHAKFWLDMLAPTAQLYPAEV
jgi:AcrR family transcriptional regulator